MPGGEMPEELRRQLEAQREQAHRLAQSRQAEDAEMAIAQRRELLSWAPVFCKCRMGVPDSRNECVIHGQVMMHYLTAEVIM